MKMQVLMSCHIEYGDGFTLMNYQSPYPIDEVVSTSK